VAPQRHTFTAHRPLTKNLLARMLSNLLVDDRTVMRCDLGERALENCAIDEWARSSSYQA
jgi:hypothetical protein